LLIISLFVRGLRSALGGLSPFQKLHASEIAQHFDDARDELESRV
jgi:hypothetical protein